MTVADGPREIPSTSHLRPVYDDVDDTSTHAKVIPLDTSWPELDDAALYGLAGNVVRTLEPHTEADHVGLLTDFLVSFGNAVGGGPHAIADGSEHPARLNAVLVGKSAKARKGTARANIRQVMALADPEWDHNRVMGGLASGEGLIAAVADPNEEGAGGTKDKRLLIVEPEFARVLGVAGRDGATLSPIVRDAWDTGRLRVMTRREPLVATGAHVSILGHVTVEELRKKLSDTEAANGFANRFLLSAVRRSKLLPSGGNLNPDDLRQLGRRVGEAVRAVRGFGLLRRTAAAEALWAELYADMADDDEPGLVGAVTARAEAQTLRLSVTYALLDQSNTIDVVHLQAAYAMWRYCADSARHIFGNTIGDPIADRLLDALVDAHPHGLDGTKQRDLFNRHATTDELETARQALTMLGLATSVVEKTGGKPRVITTATDAALTFRTSQGMR